MHSFKVFDKNIYLNPLNGDVAFDEVRINWNRYAIDVDLFCNNFNAKCFTFCLPISNSCNLACKYCFNKDKNNQLMKEKVAIRALDFFFSAFPNAEKYFIDLSGYGEPLLNLKCIEAISDYCIKKSNEIRREIIPMLSTNGVLLTKQIAEKLQKWRVLFGVSLDGNKTINDELRITKEGKGVYDIIISNVNSIKNKDYVGVSCTLTNKKFDLIDSLIELSKTFKTISYRFVRDDLYGFNDDVISYWIDQYERLTIKLEQDIKNGDTSLLFCLLNGDDFFGRFLYKMFGNIRTVNRCDAGITRFSYVDEDTICGCPVQFGNSDFYFKKADIHQKQKESLVDGCHECLGCEYKFYCGGQCPIETKHYHGLSKGHCKIKKRLIELAAYLKLSTYENSLSIFKKVFAFCQEKRRRYSSDKELLNFVENHSDLPFVEAKELFDRINKRY